MLHITMAETPSTSLTQFRDRSLQQRPADWGDSLRHLIKIHPKLSVKSSNKKKSVKFLQTSTWLVVSYKIARRGIRLSMSITASSSFLTTQLLFLKRVHISLMCCQKLLHSKKAQMKHFQILAGCPWLKWFLLDSSSRFLIHSTQGTFLHTHHTSVQVWRQKQWKLHINQKWP